MDLKHNISHVAKGTLNRTCDHLSVEASRPQQRVIEDVDSVGGCHDDDAGVALKPVHLRQQLVQRLLALVVAATDARAAGPADRIDLIDEHDARRVLLGLW